jgi:anti-anti-sigma factor
MESRPARPWHHLFALERTPDGAAASGEIDQYDADAFATDLDDIARACAEGRLVLDLSRVTFMDTTGLQALMRVVERYRNIDVVVIPSRRVFTILHLAGLADGAWENVVLYPPPSDGSLGPNVR